MGSVLMLIGNAIVNWLVAFVLIYIFDRNTPGSFLISGIIVAILAVLSVTPAGEYLTRLQFGCRKAIGLEDETFGSALQRVWEKVLEIQSAENSIIPIEKPALYVVNNKFPNAFALGSHTVIVTSGLLGSVSDEEIEGLLGHEIGHLMHGDTVKRSVACTLNLAGNIAGVILSALIAVMGFIGRATEDILFGRRENGVNIMALLFSAIAFVFKLMLKLFQKLQELGFSAVGQAEEYRADEYAMRLGFGLGLASFLSRVQYIEQLPQGLWAALTRSHPPTTERIRRLEMS